MEASKFLAELATGWREFVSRSWLVAIVVQFGFCNAITLGTEGVLGPSIAKDHLGGATAWGLILTAQALGLIAGGLILLRVRPHRLLLAATFGYLLTVPFLVGLAGPLAFPALVALAFISGIGNETFGILWETTIQQEIPQDKLSRVSSYDSLGSFALIPLGLAIAGPMSVVLGTRETILVAAAISVTATLAVLLVSDVRTIRRRED